jgi:hypothetical protein
MQQQQRTDHKQQPSTTVQNQQALKTQQLTPTVLVLWKSTMYS